MGFLSGILSGGAALNVLGGMAQGYNQKVATDRKETYESSRDDKKIEAEKSLLNKRLESEATSAMNIAKEKARIKKEEAIAVQKLKNIKSRQDFENKPSLFTFDISNIAGLKNTKLAQKYEVGKDMGTALKSLPIDQKNTKILDAYIDKFPKNVLKELREEAAITGEGADPAIKGKFNSLESNIIQAYQNVMGERDIGFTPEGGSKGKFTLMPPLLMQKMANNHPYLFDKYYGTILKADLNALKKTKGITVDPATVNNKTKSVNTTIYDDDAKGNSYYDSSDPDDNEIQIRNSQIQSLNAGNHKNMQLAEKKYYFDDLAKSVGEKDGGFLIKTSLEIRSKLTDYKMALQKPTPKTIDSLSSYFKNSPFRDKFIKNPQLALYAIKIALPNDIDDSLIFQDQKFKGVFDGQLFENTSEGRLLLEENRKEARNADLKAAGFPKPEQIGYKREGLSRLKRVGETLRDLIKKGVDNTPAFVGATGDALRIFTGAFSQFNDAIALSKDIFDPQAFTRMTKLASTIQEKAKQIEKIKAADGKVKAALLIDYYAEVLTFTMASNIQSGTDGSVDTRTISDADVKRIGNALRMKVAAAIRGDSTVLDDILIETNQKLFMLDNLSSPDRRNQSAAMIYNRAFAENVSMFDSRNLAQYDETPTNEQLGIDVSKATFGKDGKSIIVKQNQFETNNPNKFKPKADNATTSKGSISVDNLLSGGTE